MVKFSSRRKEKFHTIKIQWFLKKTNFFKKQTFYFIVYWFIWNHWYNIKTLAVRRPRMTSVFYKDSLSLNFNLYKVFDVISNPIFRFLQGKADVYYYWFQYLSKCLEEISWLYNIPVLFHFYIGLKSLRIYGRAVAKKNSWQKGWPTYLFRLLVTSDQAV